MRICWAALRPGSVIAVLVGGPDERYAKRLEEMGFFVEVKSTAARPAAVTATRCSSDQEEARRRGKGSRCLPAPPPARRPPRAGCAQAQMTSSVAEKYER